MTRQRGPDPLWVGPRSESTLGNVPKCSSAVRRIRVSWPVGCSGAARVAYPSGQLRRSSCQHGRAARQRVSSFLVSPSRWPTEEAVQRGPPAVSLKVAGQVELAEALGWWTESGTAVLIWDLYPAIEGRASRRCSGPGPASGSPPLVGGRAARAPAP